MAKKKWQDLASEDVEKLSAEDRAEYNAWLAVEVEKKAAAEAEARRQQEKQLDKFIATKRQRTEAALAKQKKIMLNIPKITGELPFFEININDVHFLVERGKKVEVPEQVADILNERLESEGKLVQASEDAKAKLAAGGIS